MKNQQSTVYIAGPMTGLPFFNARAFEDARKVWEDLGFRVLSPVKNNEQRGFDLWQYDAGDPDEIIGFELLGACQDDLECVMQANVVFFLNGWERSLGAQAEWAVSRWLGKTIQYQNTIG